MTLFQYSADWFCLCVYVSYGIVSKWEMICCFTFNSITTIYVLIYSISSRYTFIQYFLTCIHSHTANQPKPVSQSVSYEVRTKCIHLIHCYGVLALTFTTKASRQTNPNWIDDGKKMKGNTHTRTVHTLVNVSIEDTDAK